MSGNAAWQRDFHFVLLKDAGECVYGRTQDMRVKASEEVVKISCKM